MVNCRESQIYPTLTHKRILDKQTGELEIAIRYKPQDWFELGLKISALTFIGCITYLFYDWRREKGR